MFGKRKETVLPGIEVITAWDKKDEDFYAPGALIRVRGGRGLLRERFSEEANPAVYDTLMFGEIPLLQFQGSEYFCPTCEKIVRSGYGLKPGMFHAGMLNCENVSFDNALREIVPVLGLLRDHYYVILDTKLYPTDGNGHLFWAVPDSGQPMPGSCLYYIGDGEWGKLRPHFTIATQPMNYLNRERVEYYRTHPNCRAIAYYMDGYMTALIDGHHKAMAAAFEHRQVNALVIMPVYRIRQHRESGEFCDYLSAGDLSFSCREYGIDAAKPEAVAEQTAVEKASPIEMKRINKRMSDQKTTPLQEYDELAAYYPNAEEVANIDAAGEITDERLDRILSNQHICDAAEICKLIRAMGVLHHKRLFEIGDFFLQRCSYTMLPRHYAPELFEVILSEMMKLERSEVLENYLIDFMVKWETDYPAMGEKILRYL